MAVYVNTCIDIIFRLNRSDRKSSAALVGCIIDANLIAVMIICNVLNLNLESRTLQNIQRPYNGLQNIPWSR